MAVRQEQASADGCTSKQREREREMWGRQAEPESRVWNSCPRADAVVVVFFVSVDDVVLETPVRWMDGWTRKATSVPRPMKIFNGGDRTRMFKTYARQITQIDLVKIDPSPSGGGAQRLD